MSDTLEAADQAEKRKITNAYKVFFFLSLRASGMMLSLQMVRFFSRSLLRISVTLQFDPSWVYIWHTRSPYQSRSLSIYGAY